MVKHYGGFATAMAVSILALMAGEVQAQDAPSANEANGRQSTGLDEIVVTAQKRAQNLQDVPVAVTAVGGEAISQRHAVTLRELEGAVPGVQLGSFANNKQSAVFTIRGIGVLEPDPYAGNTVSIVYDGVPQYFNYGALMDLFDIDRIEILRGPQGTLFGANTTGGAVNIMTAQPTGEFGGHAQATYGNYDRIDLGVSLDLPVAENLAAKFVGFHTSQDGWIKNVGNPDEPLEKRNRTLLRGYLQYEQGNFKATLIGEYAKTRDGAGYIANGAAPGEALYSPNIGYQSICQGVPTPSPLGGSSPRCEAPDEYVSGRSSYVPDISDLNSYRATLTMALNDTPLGDITSITGYRTFDFLEFVDQDGSAVNGSASRRYSDGWQFSQELRTDARIGDRLNLTAGVFYMDTFYQQDQEVRYAFLGDFGVPGAAFLQITPHEQSNYSISGFAQAYYDITDQLQFQAGIRYQHEHTRLTTAVTNVLDLDQSTLWSGSGKGLDIIPGPDTAPAGGIPAITGKRSWDNVGWKIGLNYKPTADHLLYVSWSRGFKSGGFVGRIGVPEDIGPYKPEQVDVYEAGFKGVFLDRRLQTNLALFYTDYKDIQLGQTYSFVNDQGQQVNSSSILNASGAKIKGAEIEIAAKPVDALTLGVAATYLDSEYKDFPYTVPTSGQLINLEGARLMNTPKWSFSANAALEFDMAGGVTTMRADYAYTAGRYQIVYLSSRAYLQPTHLVGAGIDWKPNDANWSVGLWARNLFDEHYIGSIFENAGYGGLAQYSRPREYGVTVKMDW